MTRNGAINIDLIKMWRMKKEKSRLKGERIYNGDMKLMMVMIINEGNGGLIRL